MFRINQIICPIEDMGCNDMGSANNTDDTSNVCHAENPAHSDNKSNTEKQLLSLLCKKLKCRESDILSWKILKRSVDARKKPQLFYSYTLLAECRGEDKLLKRLRNERDVIKDDFAPFRFHVTGPMPLSKPPVIVGTGPAGLFCGLELARAGFRPILLERGRDVEQRTADVEAFWRGDTLRENSNVQFGEGGAGTFSDGKLNTLVKDKSGRNTHVLETFVEFGAKESILYDQKPHLGTDALKTIVKGMREEIIALGGEVRFESQVTDIIIKSTPPTEGSSAGFCEEADTLPTKGSSAALQKEPSVSSNKKFRAVAAVEINGKEILETDVLVLAIGHSARDTFFMLHGKGLNMEPKAFAVGFRVQHPQAFIDASQYGNPQAASMVGAASYKLTAKARDGRGVYSFCMCPGGYVVNASSEEGHLAVNGMSYSRRDGDCANSAVVVTVSPEDYKEWGDYCSGAKPEKSCGNTMEDKEAGSKAAGNEEAREISPLAGISFQRELEKRAYQAAGGKIPVQKYGEYQETLREKGILKKASHHDGIGEFSPAIKGIYQKADLTGILPDELSRAFAEGMEQMNGKIQGFASDEVWLCGVESRTSSPVRICRDDALQGNIRGIYPCGEGAGYAGGITSAAMDGIKVAQEIAAMFYPCGK